MIEQITTDMSQHFYRASAADIMKIPGSPIAYWLSAKIIKQFKRSYKLGDLMPVRGGMTTADNELFLRLWTEINLEKLSRNYWCPYNKGGEYRKWYGNQSWVVLWESNGEKIKSTGKASVRSEDLYFKPMIGWTDITSFSQLGVRMYPEGFIFDASGPSLFPNNENESYIVLGFLASKLASLILNALNPTLHVQAGNISSLPYSEEIKNFDIKSVIKKITTIAKKDWDSYETSWKFKYSPLLTKNIKQPTVHTSYKNIRTIWLADTQETLRLEKENNHIFIEAYGLQDELTPEIPLKEITLTCNPHYRYGGDLTDQEREDRLQSDTIAELISYAIGCMMGRYSLDREGLVYAHAGNEGFADLVAEGAYQTFAADEDAILPLTGQEWFNDDLTNRFSEFVQTVWGEQHLEENLQFIADSLCLYAIRPRKGERALDTIRRYLSNQFYKDHLSTYKRRPIYWLFSSGRHKAFECLVYLHRYHEGTLARMRTEYVIPLSSRINARINRLSEEAEAASSTTERNQINRELKTLHNQQAELATFDEQLRHHADMRISLDLDDGVKENYGKFGNLLAAVKNVTGKAAN